ncbi:MAG: DNA sulfur modification protein DndD [Magnetococcales bacterium]|nr:DNA sulfur modification protein DndD [Magnetococcales bacterium]
MIFQEITISNLFSYHGQVTFDLTGQRPDRPILLISGRNGFGKTSFLNAVKLLFTGPSEEMRSEVQAGRKLSPKEYMFGNGREWMGAFNRRARANPQIIGDDLMFPNDYFVKCRWQEADGIVDAQRAWFPEMETEPKGHLTIRSTFLKDPLKDDEAQQFLEKRLPPSYIPYFFFDGEKIQALAEANKEQTRIQLEKILNITPVEVLIEYLDKVKKAWAREGSVGDEQRKFNEIQRALSELHDQLSAMDERRATNHREIESLDEQIADRERRLRNMQGFGAREEELRHKEDLKRVKERLEELRQEVLELFIPEAPLLANPGLMQELLSRLEQDDRDAGSKKELLDYLRRHLPLQVFERPAPIPMRLREEQKQFYLQRLQHTLDEQIRLEDAKEGIKLLSLQVEHGRILRRLLTQRMDANRLQEHGRRLNEISRLLRREVELQYQLDGIGTVIEADREHYMQMQEELKGLRSRHEEQQQAKGSLDGERQRKQREMERKQQALNDQEQRIARASKYHEHSRQAEALIALYRNYKAGLKIQHQEALQAFINRHYKALMTSHDLLHHIQVDKDFALHYQDREGKLLGGANLSAGMKQMVAIALLWALREVSGKSVPVVIDTPLARIDRQNQENILQKYFPHAAEQIIVLPTDSELDKEKYNLLAPHVYREYRLENPHGDHTQRVERPMYQG